MGMMQWLAFIYQIKLQYCNVNWVLLLKTTLIRVHRSSPSDCQKTRTEPQPQPKATGPSAAVAWNHTLTGCGCTEKYIYSTNRWPVATSANQSFCWYRTTARQVTTYYYYYCVPITSLLLPHHHINGVLVHHTAAGIVVAVAVVTASLSHLVWLTASAKLQKTCHFWTLFITFQLFNKHTRSPQVESTRKWTSV